MPIHKALNHIRKQSEPTRKVIAMVITAIIAVALFVLWGVSLANKNFNITPTDINAITAEDTQTLRNGISDIFQNTPSPNFTAVSGSAVTNNETEVPFGKSNVDFQGSQFPAFDESQPYQN
jgi:hypothetical protein